MRSPAQALAASPTMVGAITTLIVIVAVFLAYNANQGLPFVPTYRVAVEVPNASRLVTANEVRIGGNRVGVVESIEAIRREESIATEGADDGEGVEQDTGDSGVADTADTSVEEGDVVARLNLKLDEGAGPLPQNSIFRVRYRSAFGLKYLEITRGDGPMAEEGFTFDGTDDEATSQKIGGEEVSLEALRGEEAAANGTFIEQTEFDDIGNTFDQRTRNAGRQSLIGFGNAFAGRGASLNLAIESLNPLFTNLRPVARMLADPETRFRRFFPELADAARIVAPVATQQAELFTNMAITFGAIAADRAALQETIVEGPPTLQAGIELLPAQQRFLAEFTDLSARLQPGVRQLRLALPDLNEAIDVGTPVLARTPRMNRNLRAALVQLQALVDQPTTLITLQRLRRTFRSADRLAEWAVPAQTVCNYFNYWFAGPLTEHITERDSVGFTQRVSVVSTPPGNLVIDVPLLPEPLVIPGEVETGLSLAGYSGTQANGKYGQAAPPPHTPGEFDPEHLPILHGNPGAPTGQDGRDCQPGQTGYVLGELRLPGQARSNPAVGVPNIPGNRGPSTVYWRSNGDRELRDTRVAARQPD